ncbi:MAG: PEGA domain-containing protein [Salinibacter sp.]|uniref:PEGA domain-containing protein n=1 Tax=Salinibacter sp. TaxID=2065818 RepID=UPI0035D3DFBB
MTDNPYRFSKIACFISAFAASFLLVGCATLFSGTSDQIKFESEPSGAEVVIDGIERGTTPTTITVSRDINDKRVTLQKEGYSDKVFRLQKEFATVAILNLGNPLFWGIDVLTGALFKYKPLRYNMELDPASSSIENSDSEKYSTYRIETLRDESTGEVVLPETNKNVIVHDRDQGVAYVFEKQRPAPQR